jgi:hypothetical protein
MAEGPASSEASSDAQAGLNGEDIGLDVLPTPDNGIVDDGAANNQAGAGSSSSSSTPSGSSSGSTRPNPVPSTGAIEKVLTEPSLGGIMNSDSRSQVFVLDQDYTVVADNGLTARFTFNPTADRAFFGVKAEIEASELVFTFTPTNAGILKAKTTDGLDVFIYSGQAPYLFDATGKRWTETVTRDARFIIQVIMDKNGTSVKEITLSLNSAN